MTRARGPDPVTVARALRRAGGGATDRRRLRDRAEVAVEPVQGLREEKAQRPAPVRTVEQHQPLVLRRGSEELEQGLDPGLETNYGVVATVDHEHRRLHSARPGGRG